MKFEQIKKMPGSQLPLLPGQEKSEFPRRKYSPSYEYNIILAQTRTVRVLFPNIREISRTFEFLACINRRGR